MPTGEYLQWRAGFTEVAWVVQELLTRCQNWEGPGPGEWNLRELVAHTIRSAALPARLLAAPEPATSDHETAVSYFLAYLAGGQPTRDTVAERGRDEARTMTLEPPDAFEVALRESLLAIRAASAGRILATPWGGIGLDEYLSSRIFELTIHGFDIAAATGLQFAPPEAALGTTLSLLTEVALATGQASKAIGALAGRDWAPSAAIFA